jgi:hypothetical protein
MSDKEISQEFINAIKKWVALDDEVQKLKHQIKEINSEKKEYETSILEFFDKIGEKAIAISDGKLSKNVSKTQVPLKKIHIQKTIFDYIKDETKTTELLETMMKNRETVEKINLKRTKNKN